MGKVVSLMVAVVLIFSLVACKKKEEPVPIAPPTGGMGIIPPSQPMQVVVPDNVKGAWSSVKITIEDKSSKTVKDVAIKLNSEYNVPNSTLNIKVGEFIPDFKMEGSVITSVSNQPNNPAVKVVVTEAGKEIFNSWLYSKFPAIHPFQHERYGLSLKEGIKG